MENENDDSKLDSPHVAPRDPSDDLGLPATSKPLRVWPLILLTIAIWVMRLGPSLFEDPTMSMMMAQFMGPAFGAILIVLWWMFFSRAPWREKLIGLVGLLAIVFGVNYLADKTVRGFGIMIFAAPWGMTAFAIMLWLSRSMAAPRRALLGLLGALIGFGFWGLVRTDEIRGDFAATRSWRWQPSPEEQVLEKLASRELNDEAAPLEPMEATEPPEWPGFRGPHRDGVQPGTVLNEDWDANPPQEKWRIPIGPGWSSFSVAGDRLFTQEQRGEKESITCYDARNGNELWAHEYESRFWEVVGGAGPRGTPTLSDGRLYALGANGILHCLDATTGGAVIWQQDISQDADRSPPQWGFSASPLVTDELVLVHAGGSGDNGILAYDAITGELRWGVAAGDHSYSSPHLTEVGGRRCVMTLTNKELTIVDPVDGKLLGEHEWVYQGYRVVQPLIFGDSVLIGTAMGAGTRCLDLNLDGDGISTEERWTSLKMNPYYNDYVAHEDYLYGFDNNIFACVRLDDGQRMWKKGRYGNGQVLLLPEANQLLVISEDGQLVLLRATPDQWTEITKFPVLDGRTWNHPVLVGDRLFVRNAEEAACFQMPLAGNADGE